MENEEFDRLFGQLKGRKFRVGQHLEMTKESRTIADQLNYLHPSMRDMLKSQYAA